ncbi:hypothetical protein FV242_32355 [Methylobacterium sp. WL64]|uniref:hypothetical protein n=1 Tax=Methylobacterium sp. WL64 TaxID=2603894 RepID=UPI0011CC62CF|nr:hypothetical protein [Methylobacterium sp. WL64]TXM97129.1 hypothetical protein FV242_32355 [Methylobacterium sp. WL64]
MIWPTFKHDQNAEPVRALYWNYGQVESCTVPFYVPEFWSDAIISNSVSSFIERTIVLINPKASEAAVLRHLRLIQEALEDGRPDIPEEDWFDAELLNAGL